jgi:signal transduction histidine kinase/HPt (histidine-containing phosphotransfer) domain-containing protein
MTAKSVSQRDDARQIFAGRIDVLYTMGRHYLSLPFAVLCVPATVLAGNKLGFLPVTPLLLQMVVVIAAEQLTAAYKKRPPGSDPLFWAHRYTFVSAIAGATWGLGSIFWFVWGSFPAQAYLALAYLGMAATEFIARSSYRPAYIVHTSFALGPLVILLLIQGGLFPTMTAVLVGFFGAVLISYSGGMGRLIDEGLSLRNQNAELVVHLQHEKAEAILARDSAQASAMAKSAFIANISHELRTPMNALLGMAQLLERAELPRQQADHVKVMLEAGRGLQTLLDDVIALTRDDDDALEDEDCDPVQTARAVTRLLQPRAWEKRLRLSLTAASDLPRVAADPRRVRQALLKLADNALKFTERGTVNIRLDLDHDAAGKPVVRFAIQDTGPGVGPDVAPRLFKPFSPGDVSYARKEQGAGLGLAVTKRIVEQAGGEIGFESTPGDGALFWFTLPVSRHTGIAATRELPAETPSVAPHGLSLLISVPAASVAMSLSNLLEPFGNRIVIAANAAEAAARTGQEHFDALIAGSDEADLLAAAPGVKAPILAVLLRGDHTPGAAQCVLRWPVTSEALFQALDSVCASHDELDKASSLPAAIDAVTFSSLEKSVGLKTLIEILQCYEATAEQLTNALAEACAQEKWDEAARLAQDIVGAAGGLGLTAMTQAARHFTKASREGEDAHALRNAAQMVVGEHVRARKALVDLYPDLRQASSV